MPSVKTGNSMCPWCADRPATVGRNSHAGGELLHRHMHAEGFFAVVLGGSYVEAGDTGRHRVAAGDVIVHRAFERHLDRFSNSGASVLVLPLSMKWSRSVLGHIEDPDAIARIAERDVLAARDELIEKMVDRPLTIEDWPDLLASDLLAEPDLSLSAWAERNALHPGSLARGFGQQFDINPAGFRTVVRSRRALEEILSTDAPLSAVASDHGFADQAHMSRSIKRMTGHAPLALRKAFPRDEERQAA